MLQPYIALTWSTNPERKHPVGLGPPSHGRCDRDDDQDGEEPDQRTEGGTRVRWAIVPASRRSAGFFPTPAASLR